jgi:hypothetical protein
MSAENCPICFGPAGDRTDRLCDGCRDKHLESMETPGSTAFIGNIPPEIGEGLPEIHRLRLRGALQKTWDYLNRNVELQDEFRAALAMIVDWNRMREATVEQRAMKYGIGPTAPVMAALDNLKAVITNLESQGSAGYVPSPHDVDQWTKKERMGLIGLPSQGEVENDHHPDGPKREMILWYPDDGTCPVCEHMVNEVPENDSRGVPEVRSFIGRRVHAACWGTACAWGGDGPWTGPKRLMFYKDGNMLVPAEKP